MLGFISRRKRAAYIISIKSIRQKFCPTGFEQFVKTDDIQGGPAAASVFGQMLHAFHDDKTSFTDAYSTDVCDTNAEISVAKVDLVPVHLRAPASRIRCSAHCSTHTHMGNAVPPGPFVGR